MQSQAHIYVTEVKTKSLDFLAGVDVAIEKTIDNTASARDKHALRAVRNRLHSHIEIRLAQLQLWLQQQLDAGTVDAPDFYPHGDTLSLLKELERLLSLFLNHITSEIDKLNEIRATQQTDSTPKSI